MANDLFALAGLLWCIAAISGLTGTALRGGRALAALGCLTGMLGVLVALPGGTVSVALPFLRVGDSVAQFALSPTALWLLGFGLAPATLAAWLGSPVPDAARTWLVGLATSLLGALGVFGLQGGAQFLIAWEVMSLGGAVMILGERLAPRPGERALFMLGLLEVGTVALLGAILAFSAGSGGLDFAGFAAAHLPAIAFVFAGLGLLVGFGAKLGLLPFYEWFPGAYATGSGASGALMSGVVLNAAYFGIARGLVRWLPAGFDTGFGVLLCAVGVISATLTALYAFQQDDWRSLLSFSTAENASVAVVTLGAALLFRAGGLPMLAGLAYTVALLHLAAHALAKGCLFLTADGLYRSTGTYALSQRGVLRANPLLFGMGALFAAMSLAAMPPQAGFVSEWFVFQTVFQSFHLPDLAGRLTLGITGAGLALTAAIALATFVKLFGVGLQGARRQEAVSIAPGHCAAVTVLGFCVLALAVGMPVWLGALGAASEGAFGVDAAHHMVAGWLLVPLTAHFAFISPSKLIIAMPLLALLPLLLLVGARRGPVRRAPVWYGGSPQGGPPAATTGLAFSNSLRTFYSFVYRPRTETEHETAALPYFVRRLRFDHAVAPIFGPLLFSPIIRLIIRLARRVRRLQSGHLNFYLAIIGLLLVAILAISLF